MEETEVVNKENSKAGTSTIRCLNCDYRFSDLYCPNCGQISTVKKISLVGLLEEMPAALFHVNHGFLFNFYTLLKAPGIAIRAYLDGKRKNFFHPATYLLLALVINYLVVKMYDMHFFDAKEISVMDPLKARAIQDYDAMQWWFLEHTYLYILLAIPVSSCFLFILFRLLKQQVNLAESAVVVLFTIAQGVLLQSSIYLLLGWINSGPVIRTVESINVILLISYAALAFGQLLQNTGYLKRIFTSIIAGAGLAVIWVASGYLLYINFR